MILLTAYDLHNPGRDYPAIETRLRVRHLGPTHKGPYGC
jgi:hypothetical protein